MVKAENALLEKPLSHQRTDANTPCPVPSGDVGPAVKTVADFPPTVICLPSPQLCCLRHVLVPLLHLSPWDVSAQPWWEGSVP